MIKKILYDTLTFIILAAVLIALAYLAVGGVYVEFWHDYKTAANLKKYCDRTAAKNGTTVVSINYRIAGEKLK